MNFVQRQLEPILSKTSTLCSSTLVAQQAKTPAIKTATKTETRTDTAKKGEKPAASPGWVVIEEEWWVPFRYDFANSLHNARLHYRNREEKAAAAEIDKAIAWLKLAENHGIKATQEDLATAQDALDDFSEQLKSGKAVDAKKLENAFAHASAALARHHHWLAVKSVADGDLKKAGQHLQAAVDHVRDAARSANHEYGNDIVEIYESYAPFGWWDDSIVLEKSKVEAGLTTVETELKKLSETSGVK